MKSCSGQVHQELIIIKFQALSDYPKAEDHQQNATHMCLSDLGMSTLILKER